MEDFETSLFEVAEDIKKDFGISGVGTPKIQIFNNEIFEKASKREEFFNFVMVKLSDVGFAMASNPHVKMKEKEILFFHSPLILKKECVEKDLHGIFEEKIKEIGEDDKKKMFLYNILTPPYLHVKLNSSFPDFNPHFLLIRELLTLSPESYLQSDEILVTLSSIDVTYHKKFITFYACYLTKKIKEMNEKYLKLLPKFFLYSEELGIDHKNPQKYFEPIKLYLPHLKEIGLNLQGKYKEDIFTQSLDDYFNYPPSLSDIYWMFGIDASPKTPIF